MQWATGPATRLAALSDFIGVAMLLAQAGRVVQHRRQDERVHRGPTPVEATLDLVQSGSISNGAASSVCDATWAV
jgi:hypothetical protein